jgi:hypothetical protein
MAKGKAKYWTEEYARRVLDSADASGGSDDAYAERHGFHPKRLYWWRVKLGRQRPSRRTRSETKERFVELRSSDSAAMVAEVTLRNGRRVTVPMSTDLVQLVRLLDAVEGGAC